MHDITGLSRNPQCAHLHGAPSPSGLVPDWWKSHRYICSDYCESAIRTSAVHALRCILCRACDVQQLTQQTHHLNPVYMHSVVNAYTNRSLQANQNLRRQDATAQTRAVHTVRATWGGGGKGSSTCICDHVVGLRAASFEGVQQPQEVLQNTPTWQITSYPGIYASVKNIAHDTSERIRSEDSSRPCLHLEVCGLFGCCLGYAACSCAPDTVDGGGGGGGGRMCALLTPTSWTALHSESTKGQSAWSDSLV